MTKTDTYTTAQNLDNEKIAAIIAGMTPEQREWLKIKSSSEPNLKLNELEDVPMHARSQDDTTPAGKQIPKSEIKAALAERAKDDDDL